MWGGTGPRFSTAGPRYYLNTLFKVRIVSGIVFLPCLCFLHAISILTGYNLSLFNLSVQEQMVSQMLFVKHFIISFIYCTFACFPIYFISPFPSFSSLSFLSFSHSCAVDQTWRPRVPPSSVHSGSFRWPLQR